MKECNCGHTRMQHHMTMPYECLVDDCDCWMFENLDDDDED